MKKLRARRFFNALPLSGLLALAAGLWVGIPGVSQYLDPNAARAQGIKVEARVVEVLRNTEYKSGARVGRGEMVYHTLVYRFADATGKPHENYSSYQPQVFTPMRVGDFVYVTYDPDHPQKSQLSPAFAPPLSLNDLLQRVIATALVVFVLGKALGVWLARRRRKLG